MSRKFQEENIREIVDDIIENMPLKDLVSFANMDESDVQILQQVFEVYIRRKIGVECEDDLPRIMDILWQRLKETHRIRTIK